MSAPLEQYEQRDTKGHYARARAGQLRSLTGVDDPYGVPADPDVVVGPTCAVDDVVRRVLAALDRHTPATDASRIET